MSNEYRNAAAMRSAQFAYDNACPPDCDDIPEQYIEDAREELLEECHEDDITDSMIMRRAIEMIEADAKRDAEDAAAARYELLRDWE